MLLWDIFGITETSQYLWFCFINLWQRTIYNNAFWCNPFLHDMCTMLINDSSFIPLRTQLINVKQHECLAQTRFIYVNVCASLDVKWLSQVYLTYLLSCFAHFVLISNRNTCQMAIASIRLLRYIKYINWTIKTRYKGLAKACNI